MLTQRRSLPGLSYTLALESTAQQPFLYLAATRRNFKRLSRLSTSRTATASHRLATPTKYCVRILSCTCLFLIFSIRGTLTSSAPRQGPQSGCPLPAPSAQALYHYSTEYGYAASRGFFSTKSAASTPGWSAAANRKKARVRHVRFSQELRAMRGERSVLETNNVARPTQQDYSNRLDGFDDFVKRFITRQGGRASPQTWLPIIEFTKRTISGVMLAAGFTSWRKLPVHCPVCMLCTAGDGNLPLFLRSSASLRGGLLHRLLAWATSSLLETALLERSLSFSHPRLDLSATLSYDATHCMCVRTPQPRTWAAILRMRMMRGSGYEAQPPFRMATTSMLSLRMSTRLSCFQPSRQQCLTAPKVLRHSKTCMGSSW